MKTTLSHLPAHKQEKLEELTDIILEKVPAEMVILFGRHARADWVEDFQETYEYVSDFDILVITKDRKSSKDGKKWGDLNNKINGNNAHTSVTVIPHSIGSVNDKIERDQYFFVDILKDGIMLFDSGKFSLSEPKNLNMPERQKKASDAFARWFEHANEFLDIDEDLEKGLFNKAAFLLHQATERYYAATLLVFTDCKPKTHDIGQLGNQVEKLHPDFTTVFPEIPQRKSVCFNS